MHGMYYAVTLLKIKEMKTKDINPNPKKVVSGADKK